MVKFIFFFFTVVIILMTVGQSFGQSSPTGDKLVPKRLTNVKDAYPDISPDGKKIVFMSNRTGNWEIFVMNAEFPANADENARETGLTQLTNNQADDIVPVWSPDGKKILFVSERDNDSEIYVMNADGSDQQRLTHQPGVDGHPHWSPDGRRIIFNSARATPDLKAKGSPLLIEVYTMNADGSDVKKITNFKTICTFPVYSPDGRKIVFRRDVGRNSEIFVANVDGTNPVNVSNSPAFDGWVAWSPDSKNILFASDRAGPEDIRQLYLVNPDGANLRKITDGPGSFTTPAWSKDGKKILAFQHWAGEEFGNLVVFEVKGLI